MGHADIPWSRSFTAYTMPFQMHICPTGRPSRSHPPADLGTGTAAARPTRSAARRANGRCRTEATAPGGGPRGGAKGLQRNGGKLKKPIQYIIWNLWVDGCNLKIWLSSKRHHPFWGVLPEGLQSPPFSGRVPAHLHLCVNEIIASEGIARELVQLRLRKPLGWCCKKPRFGTSTRKNRSDLNYTQTGGRIGGNFNPFYHEYQGLWATS